MTLDWAAKLREFVSRKQQHATIVMPDNLVRASRELDRQMREGVDPELIAELKRIDTQS